jgi:hypothetical protein
MDRHAPTGFCRDEIEGEELPTGSGEEPSEVPHALEVSHSHGAPLEHHRPVVALAAKDILIGDASAHIPIIRGEVSLKLPDPFCKNPPCNGRINAYRVTYGGIIFSVGDREFHITDLTVSLLSPLDSPVFPVFGTDEFIMQVPAGTPMFASAKRDGVLQGLRVSVHANERAAAKAALRAGADILAHTVSDAAIDDEFE